MQYIQYTFHRHLLSRSNKEKHSVTNRKSLSNVELTRGVKWKALKSQIRYKCQLNARSNTSPSVQSHVCSTFVVCPLHHMSHSPIYIYIHTLMADAAMQGAALLIRSNTVTHGTSICWDTCSLWEQYGVQDVAHGHFGTHLESVIEPLTLWLGDDIPVNWYLKLK